MDGVGAGLHRGDPPDDVLVSPRPRAARRRRCRSAPPPPRRVGAWSSSAASWPCTSSFGYPFSRIHTGRFGSARPGWSERTANEPPAFSSPVQIVTARFGTCSEPTFSMSSWRSLVCARRCSVGELGRGDRDRELARRLVGVLALRVVAAAARGREGERRERAQGEARERGRHARAPGGRSLMAVSSPKAPGTYHRRRPTPSSSSPRSRHRAGLYGLRLWVADGQIIEYCCPAGCGAVRRPEEKDGQISR